MEDVSSNVFVENGKEKLKKALNGLFASVFKAPKTLSL